MEGRWWERNFTVRNWRKQKLVSKVKVEDRNKLYERFASFQITLIVYSVRKTRKQANENRLTKVRRGPWAMDVRV